MITLTLNQQEHLRILNRRRQKLFAKETESGWFSTRKHYGHEKPIVRNLHADGSSNDPTKYRFEYIITSQLYEGTMKEIARLSKRNGWHKGSFNGTILVHRIGSKRSLLRFLGKA